MQHCCAINTAIVTRHSYYSSLGLFSIYQDAKEEIKKSIYKQGQVSHSRTLLFIYLLDKNTRDMRIDPLLFMVLKSAVDSFLSETISWIGAVTFLVNSRKLL